MRLVLVPGLLLAAVLLMPGIHVVENTWMIVEAGIGNWVPESSSLVSFQCTEAPEGGNASYCLFGRDWSNYYAACNPGEEGCRNGFAAYPKSAARQCTGFDPQEISTWCGLQR